MDFPGCDPAESPDLQPLMDDGAAVFIGQSQPRGLLDPLHLTKQVQVAAAHGQHVVATLHVDVGCLVRPTRHMTDRVQVDHYRAMHLNELRRVELNNQLFQWRAYHRVSWLACIVTPSDERAFLFRA